MRTEIVESKCEHHDVNRLEVDETVRKGAGPKERETVGRTDGLDLI